MHFRVLLATSLLTLVAVPTQAAEVLYDFESLPPATDLTTHDPWTSGFLSFGSTHAFLAPGPAGTVNTSTVVTIDATSFEIAHRPNDPAFWFPPFLGTETDAYLQFDFRWNRPADANGITVRIGRDLDGNGQLTFDHGGGLQLEGVGIRIQNGRFYFDNQNIGPWAGRGSVGANDLTAWYRMRLTMDFLADGGVGLGTLSYQDLTRGDPGFIFVVSGPLDLDQLGPGAEVSNWDSLTLAVNRSAEIDNVVVGGLAVTSDLVTEVLSDNPVGYWRLDEPAGNDAIDVSGHGNDGVHVGVVPGVEGVGCGDSQRAMTVDGPHDRTTVDDHGSLQVPAVTVEAWIRWCGDNGAVQTVLEKSRPGFASPEYGLSVLPSGQLQMEIQSTGGGGLVASSTGAVATDWTHVAATYDGAQIAIYLDGFLDSIHAAAGGPIDNGPGDLCLGNAIEADRPFNGSLDEVVLYPDVLSSQRIRLRKYYCTPPPTVACPLLPLGRKLFWTDYGSLRIQRANLDGTVSANLVTSGLSFPSDIAVDDEGRKLYWTDGVANRIQRSDLGGGNVEDVVTGILAPDGIALDVAAGQMYWCERGTWLIRKANLDGTGIETLLATGLNGLGGIALDLAANQMYWVNAGVAPRIERAKLDGTARETLLTTVTNPVGIALDLTNGKMVWTESGRVRRANLDGSGVEDLVTGLGVIRHLTVADGSIYWADDTGGTIQRADLDGTKVEPVVVGLSSPYGIAISQAMVTATPPAASTEALRSVSSYPNPFNPSTTIRFEVGTSSRVDLSIYDARGRLVRRLLQRAHLETGPHHARWDGRDQSGQSVGSGVFFYRLQAGTAVATRKLVLIR